MRKWTKPSYCWRESLEVSYSIANEHQLVAGLFQALSYNFLPTWITCRLIRVKAGIITCIQSENIRLRNRNGSVILGILYIILCSYYNYSILELQVGCISPSTDSYNTYVISIRRNCFRNTTHVTHLKPSERTNGSYCPLKLDYDTVDLHLGEKNDNWLIPISPLVADLTDSNIKLCPYNCVIKFDINHWQWYFLHWWKLQ